MRRRLDPSSRTAALLQAVIVAAVAFMAVSTAWAVTVGAGA